MKGINKMLEYRYDTQLLIEGHDLDEDVVHDHILSNFKGDCLLAVGDDDLSKYISIQTSRGKYWNTALL